MGLPDDPYAGSDWLSRATIPDMYHRKDDLFAPSQLVDAPPGSVAPTTAEAPITASLTVPGPRPTVYQRAVSFQVSAPVAPASIAIVANRIEVDAITVDVPSTVTSSVWFGYGSQVAVGIGIEIQPGIPITFSPNNTREQWEIQQIIEFMAVIMAYQSGVPPMEHYRAPRVCLDASSFFITTGAVAAVSVAVTLWYIPDQQ